MLRTAAHSEKKGCVAPSSAHDKSAPSHDLPHIPTTSFRGQNAVRIRNVVRGRVAMTRSEAARLSRLRTDGAALRPLTLYGFGFLLFLYIPVLLIPLSRSTTAVRDLPVKGSP